MANTYPNLTKAFIRSSIGIVIFLIVAAMGTGCMTTTIQSGEAGVRYSPFGGTDLNTTYGEGLQLHAPWVTIITYNVRVNEQLDNMTALSSNGLSIATEVSVRWRPAAEFLPQLHITYGTDYYRKLIQPELRSVVREVVGEYTPEQLYSSKRTELQDSIFARVKQSVEDDFVLVEAILIRDVRLPDQIKAAIEDKLKEEQEAERYEFTIAKERLEAERKKIERLFGEAKHILALTRLRLRGLAGARDEFLLTATVQNLKRLANLTAIPPPRPIAA